MYEEITKVMDLMRYVNFDWKNKTLFELAEKRKSGHQFTMQEHLESLLLSVLSGNRPWYQIEQNVENLRKVFHDYDVNYLLSANPTELADSVCWINCGNRRIYAQMEEVAYNIRVLQNIERTYGDVDALARMAQDDALLVMNMLSMKNGVYKLKGVGKALALEYLKRVGVDVVKPDVHVRRILERFGYFKYLPSEEETFNLVKDASEKLGINMMEIGSVLWSFCAVGYLEMCGATPRCSECSVQCANSPVPKESAPEVCNLVTWFNYLERFEDKIAEINRLTTKYNTYDVGVLVSKLAEEV